MIMDFFVKCGVFWALTTGSLLLLGDVGERLEWWAPMSVLWDVAFFLAPPIGIIGLAVLGASLEWWMQIRARKRAGLAPRESDEIRRERSRRARAELDEMRRERERVEAPKAAGEGESG